MSDRIDEIESRLRGLGAAQPRQEESADGEAPAVDPEAVANTRAVPLDLPATLPFASIVATDVGLIDQVTAPGGWWTPFTSRR